MRKERPRPMVYAWIPTIHLWQYLIYSAIIAALAFAMFILTFAWDANLCFAAVSFPIGLIGASLALGYHFEIRRARRIQREADSASASSAPSASASTDPRSDA